MSEEKKKCGCGNPVADGYVRLCRSCLRQDKAMRQRARRLRAGV